MVVQTGGAVTFTDQTATVSVTTGTTNDPTRGDAVTVKLSVEARGEDTEVASLIEIEV